MKATPLTESVYQYICEHFSAEDTFLNTLNREAEERGMPAIHIAPDQLSFMQVLLRGMSAKYILEIGSLAGYSTIGMARALPDDGKVVAFELRPEYGEFIRHKADEAGVGHKVEVHVGDAKEQLKNFQSDYQFDFVFIDADKGGYVRYLELVLPLTRIGGIIAGDNALAWGNIADEGTEEKDVQGMQKFNKALSAHPQLQSCLVPIGDGMAMGVKLY